MNKRALDGEAAHLESLAARVGYLIEGNPGSEQPYCADTLDGLREIQRLMKISAAAIKWTATILRGECTEAEFKVGLEADVTELEAE